MVLPKVQPPSVRPQPIWVLSAIQMQRVAGAASGEITWRAAAGADMHWPSPHVQLHGAIDSVLQDSTSKRALADRCCGQKWGLRRLLERMRIELGLRYRLGRYGEAIPPGIFPPNAELGLPPLWPAPLAWSRNLFRESTNRFRINGRACFKLLSSTPIALMDFSSDPGHFKRVIQQAVNSKSILHAECGIKECTRPLQREAADRQLYARETRGTHAQRIHAHP